MNRVGERGKGESVWLGWLLVRTIELFAPLAEARDPERAPPLARPCGSGPGGTGALGLGWGMVSPGHLRRRHLARIEGERRVPHRFHCASWAVLSGAADPARAATAMASLERNLIRRDDGLALLFTPPFDTTALDPGYIKGYPPGLRENGGQYSHAAMWAIFAFAKLGEGDKATDLFDLLNPINHAATREQAERYKVEPYVAAADIYSVAPHIGRGGWTWYTGAAGWMHRAGVEGILGIRRKGDFLLVEPCLPRAGRALQQRSRSAERPADRRSCQPRK